MFTVGRPRVDHKNADRNLILFISERGDRNSVTFGCRAGCSVDATRQGASRELRNLYYENNRRNNGNDTTSNGCNNGVTDKLATNGRPAETF